MIHQAGWRNEPRTNLFTLKDRGLILRMKQKGVNIRPWNFYFLDYYIVLTWFDKSKKKRSIIYKYTHLDAYTASYVIKNEISINRIT